MGLFGFKSKKEVAEEKAKSTLEGACDMLNIQKTSLTNQCRGSQTSFRIPYFDAFDPRSESGVPVAVGLTVVYAIENLGAFLQLNAMESFDEMVFNKKLQSGIAKYVKGVVCNAASDAGFPLVQIERKIIEVSDLVQNRVTPQVERTFGITIRSLDVTSITIDIESPAYQHLKMLTSDMDDQKRLALHRMEMSDMQLQHDTNQSNFRLQNDLQQSNLQLNNSLNQDQLRAQSSLSIDAMRRKQEMELGSQEEIQKMQLEMQRIQLENQKETMRIQREEMQRAAKLQTEQSFMGAHQANLKSNLMNKGLDNGINVFQSQQSTTGVTSQMSNMGSNATNPADRYILSINNQQAGPFDWQQLQQLVQQGQMTSNTYVWKQGMANWEFAGNVPELQFLFQSTAPQMPGF